MIGNCQHWVLDVIFGEDNHKIFKFSEKANKELLTRTALNLIRANSDEKLSVRRRLYLSKQSGSWIKRLRRIMHRFKV